jgi:lipoprotein-anchoring transpeptidase ErfK/SrfK
MTRVLNAVVFFCYLALPAAAAALDPAAVNNAVFSAKRAAGDRIDPALVKAQILLDRARFSPGEIDGKLGENAQKAITAFAAASGLAPAQPLTLEAWKKLSQTSQEPVIISYEISEDDVTGPFLKKLPQKMEEMKRLKVLSYMSPREAIAEKFHMSQALLTALNPGKRFDRAGESIFVANVLNRKDRLTLARIEIDKSRQTVKAFDPSGTLVAFFPATVGSEERPTPSGTFKVVSANANPTYRYNPEYRFKGVKTHKPFTIRPGPNNPAGSFWIGLSADGYGIHGTPDPGKISKSESHGCVRLTNWDAVWLGRNVKKGTPVVFLDEGESGPKT